MIKGVLVMLVAGWLLWFWIDKNPWQLGPLPPVADGDYISNFQHTVDLIKAGRPRAAYVYVWKAHYLVLSLATGIVVGMMGGAVSRAFARRRWAKLYFPRQKTAEKSEPGQTGKPG